MQQRSEQHRVSPLGEHGSTRLNPAPNPREPEVTHTPQPLQQGLSPGAAAGDEDEEATSQPNYTVHIPATPDNRRTLMSCTPSVPRTDHASANDCIAANPNVDSSRRSSSVHEFFISNTIFTGGYESMTRGHVMEKMVESGGTRDSSSTFSSLCSIPGCDGKAMCHPRTGDLVSPCECGYTVCRDCYIEAMESGGKCGGCKHIYKATDPEHRDKLRYRSDRSDEYGRNDDGDGADDDDGEERGGGGRGKSRSRGNKKKLKKEIKEGRQEERKEAERERERQRQAADAGMVVSEAAEPQAAP